jgi:hypothetical protein
MKKMLIAALLLTAFSLAVSAQAFVNDAFKVELKHFGAGRHVDYSNYEKLDNISKGSERKKFVHELPAEDQLTIWRIHFAVALSNYQYTQEQADLVREGARFLTKEFFSIDKTKWKGSPQYKEYMDYSDRVQKAFAQDLVLYRRTFEIPGYSMTVSWCASKQTVEFAPVAYQPMITRPDCNCSWNGGCDNWACGGGNCGVVLGCGIFGDSECHYHCL